MSEFTKDEALAFVDAMRLNLEGKVGFKWFVERLSSLSAFIESCIAENERFHAYLDWADAGDDYESYCATYSDTASQGDTGGDG